MLIIRSEQLDAFRKLGRKGFEDEMLIHLRKFSPALFETAGEDHMRKAIQLGITRAASHGFTFRGPVRLYLEFMLLFGSHFDTDPQYPWARGILNDRRSRPQMRRADVLYVRALEHRRKVAGPENIYAVEAYRRIATRAEQPVTMDAHDLVAALLREIKQLYPQKAAFVGDAGLQALIQESIQQASLHRFATARAILVIALLMLNFGHGCADDPLYPWIANALKNEAIAAPEARVWRLERKALVWLQNVVARYAKRT